MSKNTPKPVAPESFNITAHPYWREELTKLRCWISGFKEGRTSPGDLSIDIPGDIVLRHIIMAIDNANLGRKK